MNKDHDAFLDFCWDQFHGSEDLESPSSFLETSSSPVRLQILSEESIDIEPMHVATPRISGELFRGEMLPSLKLTARP